MRTTKLVLSIVIFLFALHTTNYKVGAVLFYDDFSDGNDDGWYKYHLSGPIITTGLWTVNQQQQYGMLLQGPSSIGHSIAGSFDWNNYRYEFDMLPIQCFDRNFIFKITPHPYLTGVYYYYQIHISGDKISLTKHAPSDPEQPFHFPYRYSYNIVNGKKYF